MTSFPVAGLRSQQVQKLQFCGVSTGHRLAHPQGQHVRFQAASPQDIQVQSFRAAACGSVLQHKRSPEKSSNVFLDHEAGGRFGCLGIALHPDGRAPVAQQTRKHDKPVLVADTLQSLQ